MNTQHLFTYRATELRQPLRMLIAHLKAHIAKTAHEAHESGKLVLRKSALGTPSNSEIIAARLVQDHKAAKYDLAKAELWLAEVERLGWWKKFQLTEEELRWLHRYRAAPTSRETTAAIAG